MERKLTMTLSAARKMYASGTKETKDWLEENFSKSELSAEYLPRKADIVVAETLGGELNNIAKNEQIPFELRNRMIANTRLLALLEEYYQQVQWRPSEIEGVSIYYSNGNLDVCDISSRDRSPIVLKEDVHAYLFIENYKDSLLRFFGIYK